MRKTIIAFVFCIYPIVNLSSTQAAPGPWGIALNHQTRECAGFWPGDEFVAYHLPDGWKPYFPKYDPKTGATSLETEAGSCDYKRKGDEGKCCSQLGYVYVSDNIGKGRKTILHDRDAFEKGLKKH
jgi:hypothetical protein